MRRRAIKLVGFSMLAVVLTGTAARATGQVVITPPKPSSASREASLDEYRQHLQELGALVRGCALARDAKACNPALVGEDDRVALSIGTERRLVSYGWLRALLEEAQEKDSAPVAATQNPTSPKNDKAPTPEAAPARSTTELLKDAEARLAADLAQAGAAGSAAAAHLQEHAAMLKVLTRREFSGLKAPGVTQTLMEDFGNWLNRLFEAAEKYIPKAAWVGQAIIWGFMLVVCVGLLWGLLQLERRWRVRLVPESNGPAADAASARDWQLWLEDARVAAAAGQWREAIHFVYWAAISRLESKRLWPADRARTPREYLALVAREDPRRLSLAMLTGSFERVWYGGRAADEGAYRKAEELASALISGSKATGGEAL